VDHAVARPAGRLAPLVGQYVGYRYEGFLPGTHRGMPSHHLTVVVALGKPTRLGGRVPGEYAALAAGLHTAPEAIVHDGDQYGVQLDLTPAGARCLLGLPAGELQGTVVELADLLGPDAGELIERMEIAPSWPARFAVLDEVLDRRAGRLAGGGAGAAAGPDPRLAAAWGRIVGSGGAVPVGKVAAEVGWSRRHLAQRFAREFGLGPKDTARVVRFHRSRRLLQRPGRPRLAAVAAACGYYDQAHLAREWNDLAGCPPSVWLATEEFPSVQDAAADECQAGHHDQFDFD
jgi:AraC-like DNA-binding protein